MTTATQETEVSEFLSVEAISELHPGSTITTLRGTIYTRRQDGMWVSGGGRVRDSAFFEGKSMKLVEAAPEPVTIPSDEETPTEGLIMSLEQYKQRFRTIAMGATLRNSITRDPVDRVLADLGVEKRDPYPGMPVAVDDTETTRSLPVGTVFVLGSNPEDYPNYGVYANLPGGLTRVAGGCALANNMLATILSVPEVEAPPFEVGDSDSELAAIRGFMRQAWELGVKAKAANRWCGEFEAAMSRAGIVATSGTEEVGGLSAEQVKELPVGTILRFHNDSDASVIYVRDNRATNPAGTLRVAGTLPGHWAQRFMVVVREASRPHHRIPVKSFGEMAAMPPGTSVSDGSTTYTKNADQCWYYNGTSGGYRPQDFGLSGLAYITIPVPE